MKFKFVHKIFVIQEKFLVFINLLRGPDKKRSGPDQARGPRVVHPWPISIHVSRAGLTMLQMFHVN